MGIHCVKQQYNYILYMSSLLPIQMLGAGDKLLFDRFCKLWLLLVEAKLISSHCADCAERLYSKTIIKDANILQEMNEFSINETRVDDFNMKYINPSRVELGEEIPKECLNDLKRKSTELDSTIFFFEEELRKR